VSPLELVGDFDHLTRELRASRPVAPAALREHVAGLSPAETRPRRTFPRPSGRLVLGLAAAALLASLVAAGLTRTSGTQRQVEAARPPVSQSAGARVFPRRTALKQAAPTDQAYGAMIVPGVAPARLQRYTATLRLRVENVDSLSSATRRAMRLARSLGGYVGEVQYTTHSGKRGGARIVLRVPVGSVQQALATLTGLGTILQQQTGILDITRRADRESRQIAKLQQQLAAASPEEAPAIRARLRTLEAKHRRLLRSAELARIVVTLTTPAAQPAAAPGALRRTLDDAGGVLLRELQFLLYALVVAGPLLLLGGAGIATARAARRRSDRRLLERT
jgi:Domain of unknown function (DUF4349)